MRRFWQTKRSCSSSLFFPSHSSFQFHEAVKHHILPLVDIIYENKKKKLGVDKLRPWDLEAEPAGIEPLHPFTTGEELLKNKKENCKLKSSNKPSIYNNKINN